MNECIFLSPTPFCRGKDSRSCFTGQFPGIGTVFILASLQMCKVQRQSPNTKSTDESGWMEEAAGVCGVWWGLCKEVTEGWGIAIEIVMLGWIFEREAGCKCRECCVGEQSCPSGDEGSGSGMAQGCWSVCVNL